MCRILQNFEALSFLSKTSFLATPIIPKFVSVLASDGLWDTHTNDEVVETFRLSNRLGHEVLETFRLSNRLGHEV